MPAETSASSFWISAKNCGELRRSSLAQPAKGYVRVKTLFTGISRGTETLVFAGRVPVSEHNRMRAPFQEGEFSFPVKYGYINVGCVEQGPDHMLGKTVFCLYPHQTHFNIPVESVTVLPTGLPASRAVLTANMETAINALWDAQPQIGDAISVVGAGVLGGLVAYLASGISGCEVELVDINPQRADLAKNLGVTFVHPEQAAKNRDLVIHTSASQEGLNTALDLAGFEATVLELSWYGSRQPAISLGAAFHSQRLQIKSSQVGHVALNQRARWSYQRRLQLALAQLANPCLDALISGESPFVQLPETLARLSEPGNTSLCHRITYD